MNDKKIDYALHEDIVAGKPQQLTKTMIVFSIGSKPDLDRKALATAVLSWRALKIEKSTAITMHFGGYDDDPRELWNIPEVCDFVTRFCEKTKAHEHPAVEPISRAWLLACGADATVNVEVNMISREEALSRSHEFFKETLKKED